MLYEQIVQSLDLSVVDGQQSFLQCVVFFSL